MHPTFHAHPDDGDTKRLSWNGTAPGLESYRMRWLGRAIGGRALPLVREPLELANRTSTRPQQGRTADPEAAIDEPPVERDPAHGAAAGPASAPSAAVS